MFSIITPWHKSMKSLSLKKVSDGQSDIHITITHGLIFRQIIFRSQKNWCETQKYLELEFLLMFYPPILLVERLFKWSWVLFCYFTLWLAKLGSKMPCILLFVIKYSLGFVCKSQDRDINRKWNIQLKIINCLSDTFF